MNRSGALGSGSCSTADFLPPFFLLPFLPPFLDPFFFPYGVRALWRRERDAGGGGGGGGGAERPKAEKAGLPEEQRSDIASWTLPAVSL